MARTESAPLPALQSAEARRTLAAAVMRLFEHWALPAEDQLVLLGLNPDSRTTLNRYRQGGALAASRDLLDRAGHLLGIHKSLRLLFPRNRELAYAWMRSRNRAFDGRTPVEVVAEYGLPGLLLVRTYLDRMRGG